NCAALTIDEGSRPSSAARPLVPPPRPSRSCRARPPPGPPGPCFASRSGDARLWPPTPRAPAGARASAAPATPAARSASPSAPLQNLFGSTALRLEEWGLVLAAASLVLVGSELEKWLLRRFNLHPQARLHLQ